MRAKTVADLLKAAGVNVEDFTEGDEFEDGEVVITELVSVQVPTQGKKLGVCSEFSDGTFKLFPARGSIGAIIKDIREAMGFVKVQN